VEEKKFFFLFLSFVFLFLQALEAAKSGLVLFHEAMEEFNRNRLKQSLELFERAAAKGHEESIWIVSVMKDVEMEWNAVKEAFAKTEEPLGLYFAGWLSEEKEQLTFTRRVRREDVAWDK
jgi:hypothetical protein